MLRIIIILENKIITHIVTCQGQHRVIEYVHVLKTAHNSVDMTY